MLANTGKRFIAALVAGFFGGILGIAPVQAAPVSFALSGIVVDDPFTTLDDPFVGIVGLGTVSFDDSVLTGAGFEEIGVFDGLFFDFTIFGQTFTEADDIDAPFLPVAEFEDGLITALDFVVAEFAGPNPTGIDLAGVFDFGMFDVTLIRGTLFTDVFVNSDIFAPVPLPAPLLLLLTAFGGLGGLAAVKRRRGLRA